MKLSDIFELCQLPIEDSMKTIESKSNKELEQLRMSLNSFISVSTLKTNDMTIDTFYNAYFLKSKIDEKTKNINAQKEIIIKVVEEVLSKLM